MKYKIEAYEEGREYTVALSLTVFCEEDKNDLERILLENGCSVRISRAEIDEDDF